MANSLRKNAGDAPSDQSWITPKRLLALFCIINLLNYVDRGVIASNGVNGSRGICTEIGTCTPGTGIQGDFNLTYFEDGVLSSSFMVGLLVASPIFASLAETYNPFRLIGVGLLVWTVAATGCGFSFDFWSITIFRMLAGVGEASFVSLAAPFIDDNAPPSQKTVWLALFYMCIPSGVALGYVFGGLVGGYLNWRAAFWIESVLMLPFAALCFIIKPLQLKGFSSSDVKHDKGNDGLINQESPSNTILIQLSRFGEDMKALLLEKIYVVNVLGCAAYYFVIGSYSYWGPKATAAIYDMSNADILFGGITIICGIFGTLFGGFLLDFVGPTISNGFKLLSGATFLGALFFIGAFLFKALYGFIPLLCIGQLLVFAVLAPYNYICLHCVRPNLRPLSMAMSTVAIQILGSVPSSPLVGLLQDSINNWRITTLVFTCVLFVAVFLWFIGILLHGEDRYNGTEQWTSAPDGSDYSPMRNENSETTE